MKFTPLALLLISPTWLGAEEPVQKIPASFYAFDYVAGKETVNIQTDQAKFEEIRLSKANIIGPMPAVILNGAIRIFDKPVTADGKITHPVLSSVKVPAGVTRALVVLFPDARKPAEPYRSLIINHELKDFPLGVYRLINLSPHPIRGSISREFVEAKPGGVANLKPAGEPGAVVPMRFEYFDNERWNLLTETRCAIRHDRRWLTCVYQDPATGRMNIRSIPDRTTIRRAAAPPKESP